MSTTSRNCCSSLLGFAALAVVFFGGCATMPAQKLERHKFPKEEAFVGNVERPYKTLGLVRTRVDFTSLNIDHEEEELCRNYYNKAVQDLVKRAKDNGGDAVIDVKSVTVYDDGKFQYHSTPECSDDGSEGQILTQGIAVKWQPQKDPKKDPKKDQP